AGTHVYVTQDTLTGAQGPGANSVDLTLTDLGGPGGWAVGSIAYGTRDNPNMLVAGTFGGIFQSTTGTAGSLAAVPAYSGAPPIGIVLDPRSQFRYFAADFTNLYGTTNQGLTFTNLTANLPAGIIHPTALEFISSNGVNALLVGGVNNIANAQSTIAAADSDALGNLSGWRPFGTGLPNTQVSALNYNSAADVLAVGTFGHGVFALYDVTSYFPQALVLQFGLANNDSTPDASFLTDGTVGNRALIKYGSGTLTIAGTASYTGGTTINGGALVLGAGGAGGSILGNVAFCTGGTGCDSSTNKFLIFNRSDTYTFGGSITGAGQVVQFGNGNTVLTGDSTYTGPTTISAGTLSVNGSITSAVFVSSGGTLGGNGTVGSTTINTGGTLAPGNSIGLITVNGTLMFGAGAIYGVEVAGATADKTVVTSVATLTGGIVQVVPLALPTQRQFTILSAAGGLGGTTFSASVTPPNFTSSLSYTNTDVILSLSAALGAGSVLSPNANSVATTINTIVNSGGTLPTGMPNIFALTGNDLSSAASSLSGEVHASTVSVLADESLYARSAILGRLRQASYGDGSMAALQLGGPEAFTGTGVALGSPLPTPPPQAGEGDERLRRASDGIEGALAYAGLPTKARLIAPAPTSDVVFWAQGFGAWGTFNSDGNAAAVHRDLAGFMSGVDTRIGGNGRAGFAAGYTGSQNNLDGRGSANVETGHVAAYGGISAGALNVRAGADYAFHTISTDRTIVFPGFFDRAFANYDGATGQIFAEAGYGFALANLAVEPFAGAAWVRVHTDGGAERALLAGLNFASTSFDVGYATLGIRAASLVPLANGMVLVPRASLAWQHAFGSTAAGDVLAFQAAPTLPFAISGVPIARDAALIEAGLDLALNAHATIGASYAGQLAGNVSDHGAKGKFVWKF
ncbi:MAG: autotransporter domain-containing protein, partial [Alphaproteobacteria bacterium]|nr:autotransporter domain-containing protein [Alphaproteobacteria bacterium]